MELDERKRIILHAIVRNYLETGEPVGSRTISKLTDLNLSSATIRNEMSDLEELGLIIQPHTSAGRIPSDLGYRVYVDELLEARTKEIEDTENRLADREEELINREEKLEKLLQQVSRRLAVDTNYASMISAPQIRKNKLKFIQISKVDTDHVLATIVVEGNVIKNKLIEMIDEKLEDADILKLNILLNTRLDGLSVEDINLGLIAALKQEAGIHSGVVENVIDAAAESITSDEDLQIYTSGATNIFKYPELTDNSEKTSQLIGTFEEKKALEDIVESTLSASDKENGIQVYIGNENAVSTMKDCSVVTATYELGDGMRGTIGIIGPKRMDYDKVITKLQDVMRALDDLYKKD